MERDDRNRKYIVINIALSILGFTINYGINLFLTPYITKNIGTEAYGYVTLANTLITYIDVIAIAVNSLAVRYISIHFHKQDFERANVFYTSVFFADIIFLFLTAIPGGILLSHLTYFVKVPQGLERDIAILFALVLVNYAITIIGTVFNAAVFIQNRLELNSSAKNFSYILKAFTLVLLFSLLNAHVWYVAIAYISATLWVVGRNIMFTRKLTPQLHVRKECFSVSAIWEIFHNGLWNSIASFGVMLNSGLDIVITKMFLGDFVMGQFAIVQSLINMCNSVIAIICQAFTPIQLRFFAEKKTKELCEELKLSVKISGFCATMIFAVMISLGKDFIGLWVPEQDTILLYRIAVLLLLGQMVGAIGYPLTYVFTLTKNLKPFSMVTLGQGAMNVISMLILLQTTNMGLYAIAATTTVLNIAALFILAPILAARYLEQPRMIFCGTLFRVVFNFALIAGIMKSIAMILPVADNWSRLIVNGVILGVCGLMGSVFGLLKKDERSKIVILLKQKIRR